MATIYTHGSFLFFVFVCVACLLGIFGIADTGVAIFWRNLFTVAFEILVGAGVTIFFIDRLNDYRATENLKWRLIREAGSRSRDIAISAVEWMDREGWLQGEDGLLKGADLRNARLSGARLNGANMQGAKLHSADLHRAELKNANLEDTDLTQACFCGARSNEARLNGATMIGTVLKSANLNGAILQGATMIKVDVEAAFFFQADLTDATLLDMVNLRDANFSLHQENSIHSEDSYKEALERNANLKSTQLRGADLRSANLRMVNLKGAILWNADLQGAKLAGTNLQRANLSGAFLKGANIQSESTVSLSWTDGPDDDNSNAMFFPKTDFSGATLPDGTRFTEDMNCDDLKRFTMPNHHQFASTLEKVKAIRDPSSVSRRSLGNHDG